MCTVGLQERTWWLRDCERTRDLRRSRLVLYLVLIFSSMNYICRLYVYSRSIRVYSTSSQPYFVYTEWHSPQSPRPRQDKCIVCSGLARDLNPWSTVFCTRPQHDRLTSAETFGLLRSKSKPSQPRDRYSPSHGRPPHRPRRYRPVQ